MSSQVIAQVNIVSNGIKNTRKDNPTEMSPGTIAYLGFPSGRKTGHVNDPKEKNTGQKKKI